MRNTLTSCISCFLNVERRQVTRPTEQKQNFFVKQNINQRWQRCLEKSGLFFTSCLSSNQTEVVLVASSFEQKKKAFRIVHKYSCLTCSDRERHPNWATLREIFYCHYGQSTCPYACKKNLQYRPAGQPRLVRGGGQS